MLKLSEKTKSIPLHLPLIKIHCKIISDLRSYLIQDLNECFVFESGINGDYLSTTQRLFWVSLCLETGLRETSSHLKYCFNDYCVYNFNPTDKFSTRSDKRKNVSLNTKHSTILWTWWMGLFAILDLTKKLSCWKNFKAEAEWKASNNFLTFQNFRWTLAEFYWHMHGKF